jgi:hypothetical protein
MFSLQIRRCLKTMIVLATFAFTTGSTWAGVVINFDELANEAGIRFHGTAFDGTPFDVTKLGSETFHVSSPVVPGGYNPDAVLSHIGISRTSGGYLVNILESDGGPISDQIWVHQFVQQFTVIDFISDPAQFVTGVDVFATVVETGSSQNVLNYLNDRGEQVSINIISDVDATVPEPGTILLISAAMVGIAATRRRTSIQRSSGRRAVSSK